MSFNVVTLEENLENLLEELTNIGFEEDYSNQDLVYYKDTHYTVFVKPCSKTYNIQESSFMQKLITKHYKNESYQDLFDKNEYILVGEGVDLEIVSLENVYEYVLRKEGFTNQQIKHIASYETISKHDKLIRRLKANRSVDDIEPPKIEDNVNVVVKLIEDNIDMFRKYVKIDELNDILKENDPEESSGSSFSDIFTIPKSYKHTFNVKYDNFPKVEPSIRTYNTSTVFGTTPTEEVSVHWIQEELDSMESQNGGLKEFSVDSEAILLSLMQYLSVENYMWQFENLNENAEPKYYPIAHAPVSSLYENGFFNSVNDFNYGNKMFTVNPSSKVVQYWGVECSSDEENLETMREVFPKLALN